MIYIAPGLPHALGAGFLAAEIQEPTDITLRAERIRPDGTVLPEQSLHSGIGYEGLLDCFSFRGADWQTIAEQIFVRPKVLSDTGTASERLLIGGELFHASDRGSRMSPANAKKPGLFCGDPAGRGRHLHLGRRSFPANPQGDRIFPAPRPSGVPISRKPEPENSGMLSASVTRTGRGAKAKASKKSGIRGPLRHCRRGPFFLMRRHGFSLFFAGSSPK